jgi:hypothetical protein
MAEVPDDYPWPPPWKPVPLPSGWLGRVESVEAELQLEVCPGHVLYGVPCRAVGWNPQDPNEFLFATNDPGLSFAFVHLTWRTEQDPTWPYTLRYPNWDPFRSAWESENR